MIKWWKGIFDDLSPYDRLSMDSVLDRYHRGMKSFDQFEGSSKHGATFVNIHETYFKYPELLEFHRKYNSPHCNPLDYKTKGNYYEPNKKLCFKLTENCNFAKKEYEDVLKFRGHTSNYNGRDGQIRGGFATPSIHDYYYLPKIHNKITGEWLYQEIPHELIYNNLRTTSNGVDISISKQFVKEVTNGIGWDDIEKVKKIVDEYDEKYPDWNHDFPINGFMQMRKDGILFPAVWTHSYKIMYHSFHRLVMTSFNEMDFPYIIPIPYGKTKWTGQSKLNNFYHEGEYKYLNFHYDLDNKKTEYEFTNEVIVIEKTPWT